MIARSGWGPDDAVLSFSCAPFGGHRVRAEVLKGDPMLTRNMLHIHTRAGAFDFYSGGNYFVIPPGYGGLSSAVNSTLTIEGADQQRDPARDARLRRIDLADGYVYAAGTAAEVYPSEIRLAGWTRHLAWLKPDLIVIADELEADATLEEGRQTVWRMNYDNRANEAEVSGLTCRVKPRQAGDGRQLAVQVLEPRAMALSATDLRLPNATWTMCGQLQAAATDIFSRSRQARIVAVLEVLDGPGKPCGQAASVEGSGVLGASVERDGVTRAAVFVTAGRRDDQPLAFTVTGGPKLHCLVFGLPAQRGFAADIRRQERDGRTQYAVTLVRGDAMTTNAAGTLTVTSGDSIQK
ncbi:MAG: hypothetical protein GX591_04015 [Planctomycetes bacterium]|nr:hypothetical protein [Planctomycetota bacterium]